ncbi:Voltage-dependent calcium channel subunit alpha-2/delta-4 [Liparis tanakae]|uniref:Voltage-dependent calcium channel subunit alpha-2/delta-4 n=1 Tax=Liparis tanakae TaxID=230148 RepID=A0A4Z2F5C0_9TELE|nr:Voltage-dependent calcium channel subunit alpha-2/delta-4 [Liparis tanakae]
MVRGETGFIRQSIRASVDKKKRPLFLVNDYFYTNIDETPFSFGMVLTRGHGRLMFIGNVSVEEGMGSHNALLHSEVKSRCWLENYNFIYYLFIKTHGFTVYCGIKEVLFKIINE